MSDKIVRIGGATGGEVDGAYGLMQLLAAPDLDYVILDYLSEPSMAPLGGMAAADPESGYLADFLNLHVEPTLPTLASRGIKLISNGGGINPKGAAAEIERRAAAQGIKIRVAAITGDDIRDLAETMRAEGRTDMFNGSPFPSNIRSMNAYIGAFPVAAALAKGADIVLTGRVVDSALVLGPLIHEFGWTEQDYDLLAAGTVAGHLLECGAQVAGGTFTDWRDVPDWTNPSYPIGEISSDGTTVITKVPGTGGLVSVGTVSEQLLYEVSDPQAYIVPDVVCDFSEINLEQIGPDRVRVTGARGYPPTETYKVCTTYADGWRAASLTPIIGIDAEAKAERRSRSLVDLTRRMLRDKNLPDWTRVHTEVIGTDQGYGPRRRPAGHEVIAKIVVEHPDPGGAEIFWREERASQMYMSVGTASPTASYLGAPRIVPVTRLFSFLLEKDRVALSLTLDGKTETIPIRTQGGFATGMIRRPQPAGRQGEAEGTVPLIALAWARSGDKGNLFNVGVIARNPVYLPWIRAALTTEAVADWYRHLFPDPASGRVDRYDAPGFHALNFVVHEALEGGVASGSPLLDRSAKGMGQQLLEFPIPVPRTILLEARATLDQVAPSLAAASSAA
jgi:hypothetical protein